MEPVSRRHVLHASTVSSIGILTGCSALGETKPPEDQGYDRLQRTAVYVEENADISFPDEVQIVTAATNADLVLLAGETDVGVDQAVDWLAAEKAVGLLGDGAESTWLAWARSETYRDTFKGEGVVDSEPNPILLVAAAEDVMVSTYRRSWADQPRNGDLLRALDEILAAVETETPS